MANNDVERFSTLVYVHISHFNYVYLNNNINCCYFGEKYTKCLNYANKKVKNHMLALGKPSCNKVNVYKYIQYVFLFRCFRNIPPYFLRKIIIIIIDIITVIVLIMLLMLTRPITAKIITLQRLIAHLFVCYINRPLLKIT